MKCEWLELVGVDVINVDVGGVDVMIPVPAKITFCASTSWPSSQARVTSAKSLSSLKFPKAILMLSWKSFHWRQSFSDILNGWDGIYCGYWCRHRSKDCSKAHHLPSRASTFWVGRVIPKNNLHHDHVCTDEFTQTGATRLLDSDLRRKMLKSTEGGSILVEIATLTWFNSASYPPPLHPGATGYTPGELEVQLS